MVTRRYFVATSLGGELRPVDHWLYADRADAEERVAFDPERRLVLDTETEDGATVFRRGTRTAARRRLP